jgi:hypothetical protein
MDKVENYIKGARAWFPDETEGWVLGICQSKVQTADKIELVFNINGKV